MTRDNDARTMSRFGLLIFLAALCRAQDANPLASDPRAAETGRWMFRIYCAPCHGIHADGGRGPDLTRGSYSAGDKDMDLFNAIARGVPGSEMQGYGDRFDSTAIWRLVSYVRSVARRDVETIQGDASAGEKAFWEKGACGQCHRVGSKGSGIGPDLSRVGRERSLNYLRNSIANPDAEITPGYGTIKIVLTNGKTIVGVEKGLDNFSAQLIDLSGKYYSFERAEVASISREPRSLMPSYDKVFEPREMDDLLAYLISLRGNR